MPGDRRLRWRAKRGDHALDLFEEVSAKAPSLRPGQWFEAPPPTHEVTFVGLLDGREIVRAKSEASAGAALIQAAYRRQMRWSRASGASSAVAGEIGAATGHLRGAAR